MAQVFDNSQLSATVDNHCIHCQIAGSAFVYGFEPVGREFESLRAHHNSNRSSKVQFQRKLHPARLIQQIAAAGESSEKRIGKARRIGICPVATRADAEPHTIEHIERLPAEIEPNSLGHGESL